MLSESYAFNDIIQNVINVILMLRFTVMIEIQRCINECTVKPLLTK